jgi:outer membrane protein assembly factor BamB
MPLPFRRCTLVPLFALGVLLLGSPSCSTSTEDVAPATEPSESVPPASQPPTTAPPPAKAVRVVDGDTHAVVRHVRAAPRGRPAVLARGGVARLGVPTGKFTVRVSAPGYAARTVRLDFRKRLSNRVELWRPALQWPLYGANAARTQVQSGIDVRPPFRIVWRRNVHGLMEFPATTWAGVAYVHTMGGMLRAISMGSGRVIWKRRTGSLMASSPAIDPQRRVLVSTTMQPGYVTVRSLATGRVRWRYYTGLTEPSPVIRNGVAYFGATNGNVYALDLDKRKPRWVFHGGVKITSSPALVGGRLYFGDYAGRVFALDSRSGRVIWQGTAGGRVYGTVAVSGGRVFAPSVFSGLSALSARTGRLLWRVSAGSYVYSSPAAYKGRVYFGAFNGLVYAVSAKSGRVLWTRAAGGRVSGAVQVVDGLVYAASLEGRTSAWNAKTGKTVWTFPHGKYVPLSGSGERLLLHGEQSLYAVEHKRRG